jgi:ribulose-5-phosphate 4-epimerase/fuculose-1-phosphate aldolase
MAIEPSEGVIKFKFNLKMSSQIEESLYINLEKWRVILFKMNLIGEYPTEKVGFGNLSRKVDPAQNQFIITGTQTGKYPNLDGSQYTKVTKCDLQKMSIEAMGPIAPSSESLTHYAIYESCPQVNAIFHVHHNELWKFMLSNNYTKTANNINYGTQEMAHEAQKCIGKNLKGIFVMEGHQDGIIAYGHSVEEAGKIILETLKESKK